MRRTTLLVIFALGVLAAACSESTTAPRSDDPNPPCKSGYQGSTGWVCTDSL